MKNHKWGTRTQDDRPVHVVLFVSRNKDNNNIDGFKSRTTSFITKEPPDSEILLQKFKAFVNNGLDHEMSRFYYSVNARNEDQIYKDLMIFLIQNPDFNLCSIESKLAGIAAISKNAVTKQWMFDFDYPDEEQVLNFCSDISEINPNNTIACHKTPNGYAIITEHGFDTRGLFKKWDPEKVTLKRDDLLCVKWTTKEESL